MGTAAALKGKKVIELLSSLCATNVFFLTIPVIIFRAVCASVMRQHCRVVKHYGGLGELKPWVKLIKLGTNMYLNSK